MQTLMTFGVDQRSHVLIRMETICKGLSNSSIKLNLQI